MTGQSKADVDVLLAQSLKELAVSQPIEKITIKEIAERAGVIRPTFYNHFQDKYELLEWILERELLEPIQPLVQNGMITEAMELMLTTMEKDRAFYTKAVKMEGAVSFGDIANACARRVLLQMINTMVEGKRSKHEWLTPEIIAAYYAQSMCFALIEWIKSGMAISPKEMAEAYKYIITRSMDDIIREM